METQKMFMDKCSECGSTNLIYDYDVGEIICGGCGLVIHEQMMSRVVRLYPRIGEGISKPCARHDAFKEKLYNIGEAARLIGISYRTIKRWIWSGKISVFSKTSSGRCYVLESEIGRLKKLMSGEIASEEKTERLVSNGVTENLLTVSNVEEKILQYWKGGVKKLMSGELIDVRGGGNSEERDSDIEVYQLPFGRWKTSVEGVRVKCPYCGRTLGKRSSYEE